MVELRSLHSPINNLIMPAIKNNRIKQQIDRFKKSFLQSKELGIEVFFLPTALPTLLPIHRINVPQYSRP